MLNKCRYQCNPNDTRAAARQHTRTRATASDINQHIAGRVNLRAFNAISTRNTHTWRTVGRQMEA
eukprot:683717-Lingulodinium_polyedra.AAC.1